MSSTEVNSILLELSIFNPFLTRIDVFERIFIVFLGLGTLVGVIVVSYTLYNAYKYRDGKTTADADEETVDAEIERPQLGELPIGGEGGKKLFVSFILSAIIVISLIVWTFTMFMYVENPDEDPTENAIEVDVEGFTFGWSFYYEDDDVQSSSFNDGLVVPENTTVWINVTATDVWHTFGITEKRVKADAIPGETATTWFVTGEPGHYPDAIECFELCGAGHSGMTSDLTVLEEEEFEEWYEDQLDDEEAEEETNDDDEDNETENGDE